MQLWRRVPFRLSVPTSCLSAVFSTLGLRNAFAQSLHYLKRRPRQHSAGTQPLGLLSRTKPPLEQGREHFNVPSTALPSCRNRRSISQLFGPFHRNQGLHCYRSFRTRWQSRVY
uniref:Putative secreted protein n=1 Tax=Ixodes ricinus TaxID=34613 RepID=A0A6B0UKD8_IXORI